MQEKLTPEQRRRRRAAAIAEKFGDNWMLREDALKLIAITPGSFNTVTPHLRCRPNSTIARTARNCGLLVHRDDVRALIAVRAALRTSWRVAAKLVQQRVVVVEALGGVYMPEAARQIAALGEPEVNVHG